MIWHRIENGVVVETTDIDPAGRFHPSLVWVEDKDAQAHQGWLWNGSALTPPPAPSPEPLDLDAVKWVATQKRWAVETGGLTLPGGVHVATALDDQNRITTVVANARLAGLDSVKFKAASGWVTLNVAEVEGIAAAIAMHVQACFAAECAHHEAIDALAALHADNPQALQQALEGYDIEQGWPATDLREPQAA